MEKSTKVYGKKSFLPNELDVNDRSDRIGMDEDICLFRFIATRQGDMKESIEFFKNLCEELTATSNRKIIRRILVCVKEDKGAESLPGALELAKPMKKRSFVMYVQRHGANVGIILKTPYTFM